MLCPECGLFNADTATRCDCGCELDRVDFRAVAEAKALAARRRRAAIAIILMLGACAIGYREWDDWTFRQAAAGLGLGGESSFPFALLACFVVAVMAGRMLFLALRSKSVPKRHDAEP